MRPAWLPPLSARPAPVSGRCHPASRVVRTPTPADGARRQPPAICGPAPKISHRKSRAGHPGLVSAQPAAGDGNSPGLGSSQPRTGGHGLQAAGDSPECQLAKPDTRPEGGAPEKTSEKHRGPKGPHRLPSSSTRRNQGPGSSRSMGHSIRSKGRNTGIIPCFMDPVLN